MKKIILALFSLATFTLAAQDTIITRAGEVIPAKVYEITPTEIKYKKPTNPDGPMYVTSKEDVAVIEYKNGSKDVFRQEEVNDVYNTSKTNQQANNTTYQNSRPRVNVILSPPAVVVGPGWGRYRPYRHHRLGWRWSCGWWW